MDLCAADAWIDRIGMHWTGPRRNSTAITRTIQAYIDLNQPKSGLLMVELISTDNKIMIFRYDRRVEGTWIYAHRGAWEETDEDREVAVFIASHGGAAAAAQFKAVDIKVVTEDTRSF